MNTNREKKVIETKNTKTKITFKNNTFISWILYKKWYTYEVDNKLLSTINFNN